MSQAVAAEEQFVEIGFPPPRLVINVAEMLQDPMITARAERFIRNIGQTAMNHVEVTPISEVQEPQFNSFSEAIQAAAEGNETARNSVKKNVRTDTVERVYKAGNVIEIKVDADADANLSQFGQSMESVYGNGLLYASDNEKMKPRSEAETRNGFRIQQHYRQGLLKEHYLVVISRCADDMSEAELRDNGFFNKTKTCVIQATTEADGGLSTKSAFMAGVKAEGEERHDQQTVVDMGEELGIDYAGMTSAQIIDRPILIHKSKMPNGVIDMAALFDKHAGGTFFGEDKPAQDYVEYEKFCFEREAQLEPTVERITNQLIAEAAKLKDPLVAAKRLNKLSQEGMVERAIKHDSTIDADVFGSTAAKFIDEARSQFAAGNYVAAQRAEEKAQATAVSSSCPSALNKDKKTNNEGTLMEKAAAESEQTAEISNEIRCIKCREYVKKDDVIKADCWECPKCKHKVDICTGEIVHEGETESSEEADQPEPRVSLAELLHIEKKEIETLPVIKAEAPEWELELAA